MPTPTATLDPGHLTKRVREMIESGRVRAARPLLAALGKISVPSSELDELHGLLLLREGRAQDAILELDAAIARNPGAPGLYICRADARMRLDNVAGAAADAAEAVILSPRAARAKALLGVILIELGRPGDAARCLAEAVAAEPRRAAYHQGLAQAQERMGEAAAAAETLRTAIRLLPGDTALRTAAIMLAMRQRDFETAASVAETARREGAADACIFGLLGHAYSSLGRYDSALDAYTDALKLAPEDPSVRHLVSAARMFATAEHGPGEGAAPVPGLLAELERLPDDA